MDNKFKSRSKNPDKSIFSHVTCATGEMSGFFIFERPSNILVPAIGDHSAALFVCADTSNVKFVFNAVVAIILEENLKASGLA